MRVQSGACAVWQIELSAQRRLSDGLRCGPASRNRRGMGEDPAPAASLLNVVRRDAGIMSESNETRPSLERRRCLPRAARHRSGRRTANAHAPS